MDIRNTGVLVNLHIPSAAITRTDRKVTDGALAENSATSSAGRFVKNLIPASKRKQLQKELDGLRQWHYRLTAAWDDANNRLLPAGLYFEYMEEYGKHCRAIEQQVKTVLINGYDDVISEAKAELGGMYDERMMPTAAELAERMRPSMRVLPMPAAETFKHCIGLSAVLGTLERQLQDDIEARVKNAMGDVHSRVREVLERIVDRLGQPDAVFRDSLINNARDLVGILPALNITKDPAIDNIVTKLAEIASIDPEALRSGVALRTQTANDAAALLRSLNTTGV